MRLLMRFMRPYRGLIAVTLFAVLIDNVGTLLVPTMLANMVNTGITTGDVDYILRNGLYMLIATGMASGGTVLGCYLSARLAANEACDIRNAVYDKSLELSASDFERFGTGSMITRSLNDINVIQQAVLQTIQLVLPVPFLAVAGIIFAAASFTDFLDGHLARKWNMVTDFGKFADPLADKLLTTVAFIYMMRDGVCSPVVLCIILARRQHVGQGEDRAADAEHHLLLLWHGDCGECVLGCHGHGCGSLGGAVLAGGCRDGHFRHQVPVGQPQLHQHRKIKRFLKKGRETCPFSNFRGNITRRKGFP